jgi:hypothetical protein
MKIAIATCFNIPELDIDEDLILEMFSQRGHEVQLGAWEDASIDWADFDAVVVRSTWNYPHHVDAFSDWIKRVDGLTILLNPAQVMLGNLNKRYLNALRSREVSVIDTQWLFPNAADSLQEMLTVKSVIKPAVGAGSLDTRVFEPSQVSEAIAWLASQAPQREFMIQEFLESVHSVGEQSIIVIAGEPTHRITKHPRFAGQEESVEGPFEVGEFEPLVRQVIEPLKDEILYARVDLMMDGEGVWRLSELELVEPSLFFIYQPSALDRLIDRVEELLA